MAFFFPANIALLCESASRQVRIGPRRLLFQGPCPHQTIAGNTILSGYQLDPSAHSLYCQFFLPFRSFMLSHLEATLIKVAQNDASNSFRSNTYDSPRKCCKQKTYSIAKSFKCNTYKKHRGVGRLWLTRNPFGARRFALSLEGIFAPNLQHSICERTRKMVPERGLEPPRPCDH